MTIANDQIACPECGYGWNDYTRGFHYTHCSKVDHLNHEQPRPEQGSGEPTTQQYIGSDGYAHEVSAPAAPERGEWRVIKTIPERPESDVELHPSNYDALRLPWHRQELLEVIVRYANGYPKAAKALNEYKKQHSTLIEQRERALEALKGVAIMLNTELEKYDSEPWAQRVRAVLTTIEQERGREGQQ